MKFTGTSLKKNLIDNLFEQVLGQFMHCFCVVCKVCEESLNVQRILKQKCRDAVCKNAQKASLSI